MSKQLLVLKRTEGPSEEKVDIYGLHMGRDSLTKPSMHPLTKPSMHAQHTR